MKSLLIRAFALFGMITLISCYAQVRPVGPPVAEVEVELAPPPQQVEAVPAPPYGGAVWIEGYWHWSGVRYIWIGGHYERPRPGWIWVPHRWARAPRGHWRYHAGYWRHY
ncbi:MAG TPA: hypothetical protein VKN99_19620 [Polyangia bacterium]|nr:hypothetical protein [Polyangia bacterium]